MLRSRIAVLCVLFACVACKKPHSSRLEVAGPPVSQDGFDQSDAAAQITQQIASKSAPVITNNGFVQRPCRELFSIGPVQITDSRQVNSQFAGALYEVRGQYSVSPNGNYPAGAGLASYCFGVSGDSVSGQTVNVGGDWVFEKWGSGWKLNRSN